mgnify:FL=1
MTPQEPDIYDRHLNIVRKSVFSEACASHCISGRYADAPSRQHFHIIAEKAFPPYGRGFPAMRNTLSGHTKHTVRNAGRAFPATPAHPEETAIGMKRTCRTQKDAMRKPEWEMPGHNMSARFNLKNQKCEDILRHTGPYGFRSESGIMHHPCYVLTSRDFCYSIVECAIVCT